MVEADVPLTAQMRRWLQTVNGKAKRAPNRNGRGIISKNNDAPISPSEPVRKEQNEGY